MKGGENMSWHGILLTDWISAISSAVGLVIAIIAIIQSNKSIQLTKSSISEANRPVLVAHFNFIDITHQANYLVIKNYGNSSCKITSISTTLKDTSANLKDRLPSLIHSTFAPGQSFSTEILGIDGKAYDEMFEVNIKCVDNLGNSYNESFKINPKITNASIVTRQRKSKYSDDTNAILSAIQDLVRELR